LAAKKLPGVCSWCSEKGVKSSTLGAVVIVVSDMFGDRGVLVLLDGMEGLQWLREVASTAAVCCEEPRLDLDFADM
jgi:hypothetical protein